MGGRIRLTVRYDGTDFAGSQAQPGLRTVEGTLKSELELLYRAPVKLLFASRTDTGVHADGNTAAFDAPDAVPPVDRLAVILNSRLPGDLRVRDAAPAADSFHPRFDAASRTYVYRVYLNDDIPVDRARYCAVHRRPLDVVLLGRALSLVCGSHSFHRFSASGFPPEQSICTVVEASHASSNDEVSITLRANRFLRHMVCRLVAGLIAVADGRMQLGGLQDCIEGRIGFQLKRAPAKGLTLRSVEYAD
jgi:tRNA pseudouridine38-40 synthase